MITGILNVTNVHLAIIGNDDTLPETLLTQLITYGHTADFFNSVEAFIKEEIENFDCILLEFLSKNGQDGLEQHRQLVENGCKIPVIITNDQIDPGSAYEAGKQGVNALLSKPIHFKPLWTKLQEILNSKNAHNHQCQIPKKILLHPETMDEKQWNCFKCHAKYNLTKEEFRRLDSLSLQEARVFLLLAQFNLSNRELADILNIRLRTVESHRSNMFSKLDRTSVAQLRELLDKILGK